MPAARSAAQVEALYQELILDHYRRPRNKGAPPHADARATIANPLCGDEVTVYLAFDGDVVREARFAGQGCSISQAAASMLTGATRGRGRADAIALLHRYGAMLAGDREAARDEVLGELRALSGVARFPARVLCAALPAQALVEALTRISECHHAL